MMDWLPSLPALIVAIPMLAAVVLVLLPDFRLAARVNIGASALIFALSCGLPWNLGRGEYLLADHLSVQFVLLTSFIGLTTAWFSEDYVAVEFEAGRLDAPRLRLYHAMFQAFLGFLLLALLSNNLGLTWVSVEAATIAAVVVVGLPRTEAAIEASWRYFMLGGVAIALALFGTITLYLAAQPIVPGWEGMSWTGLARAAPLARGAMLNLAFVFLLIGYGTKAGLAPLHAWLPNAHAEGPTPVSAVLSGSILNVALVVIIRLREVMEANALSGMGAIHPGPPIMALGLISVLMASFSMWRRRDAKRFFAFSSIEQNGIAALAIGIGSAAAIFAAILHMVLHTLTKAAIFHCIGRATQLKGGQKFTDIGGLISSHRALGITLALAIIAIAGIPPIGVFVSEFLVIGQTIRHEPLLAVPLGIGLVVSTWALFMRLQSLCLGDRTPDIGPAPSLAALIPTWVHLAIVLVLGVAMPGVVFAWMQRAAGVLL